MRIMTALLLFVALPGWCGSTVQKAPYARQLYARMAKQAATAAIDCGSDGLCRVDWVEKKGVPISFEDTKSNEDAELAALKALVVKWKAGTITASEKDDLIKRFIVLQLEVK